MTRNNRKILSVIIGIFPFFAMIIIWKLNYPLDISGFEFLLWNVLLGVLGLAIFYLLIKYFLKEKITDYFLPSGPYILEISLTFFLLIAIQLIYSIENLTYNKWIDIDIGREQTVNILNRIFEDPVNTIFFLCPYLWILNFYLEFSRVFMLKNLWINNKKLLSYGVIVISAVFFSLLMVDRGINGMITWFFISLVFNTIYFKYKRILPLIIAAIFTQFIGLLEFYIRMS